MSDVEDFPDLLTAPPFPSLLPPNETRLETAIAEQTGRLDNQIPNPLDRMLQPWLCPTPYLPWLAWHMSLSLWDWEWGEVKRRAVIARAVELNRMKGTAKAIREYCKVMDSEAVEIKVPPQEFYIGDKMSKERWDAWIHQMPEIRIKLIHGEGTASYDSWFIQSAAPLQALNFESGSVPNIHRARLEGFGTMAFGESTEAEEHAFHALAPYPQTAAIPIPHFGTMGRLQWGWVNHSFVLVDDGPWLYGRRIVERIGPNVLPLQYVEETTYTDENQTIDVERVCIPGKSTYGFFLDHDFIDNTAYIDQAEKESRLVTLRLDGTYVHERSELGLSLVWPDLAPQSPRYERVSDVAPAQDWAYLGDMFIGQSEVFRSDWPPGRAPQAYPPSFIPHSRAGDLLADRIFLIDPDVPVPWMPGTSFVGVDRFGMDAFTAEVMVDLKAKERNDMLFVGEGFVSKSMIGNLDEKLIDRACYAIVASKAARDKILVNFAPLRQITPTDTLTTTMRVGDWIADRL